MKVFYKVDVVGVYSKKTFQTETFSVRPKAFDYAEQCATDEMVAIITPIEIPDTPEDYKVLISKPSKFAGNE